MHPAEGAHLVYRSRAPKGNGHLAFFTDDLENQIKKFEELGIKVIQTGEVMGGLRFAYAQAKEQLGCDIEFIELKKRKKKKK